MNVVCYHNEPSDREALTKNLNLLKNQKTKRLS